MPLILLAVASADPLPASSRAFSVEEIANQQAPDDVMHWLQGEYLAEAQAWESDEELALLLDEVAGRRKFQGFGLSYAAHEKDDCSQHIGSTHKPSRVAGGSAKGGAQAAACPLCGNKVDFYRFTVPAEQVQRVGGHLVWTGPPSAARVAA